jgi:signal transduction histidine kinase
MWPGAAGRTFQIVSPDPATTASLAALRQTRSRQEALLRQLRFVGPLVLIGVTVGAIRVHPGPGLDDRGLAISAALAAFAAGGLIALATRDRPGAVHVASLFVLLAGSAALMWLQPDGVAVIGIFTGVILLSRQVPGRFEIALYAAGAVFLALLTGTSGIGTPLSGLLGSIAVVGFFGMCLLARRLRKAGQQADELLAELEQTRAGEARAAGLAERQRLAREMHDVLAHSLSGLMLQLEGARMLAAENAGENAGDLRLPAAIERAHHLAQAGLDEAGRAIGMLRGDELPGPERLPGLAAQFQQDSGVPCRYTVSGPARALGAEARLAVYRVAQEALTNVTRHASAARVEVRLAYEPASTRLTVEDFAPTGDGPDPASQEGGYGLTGMRERAELLGGTLTAMATGTGFRVELRLPVAEPQEGPDAG